jgi:ketose-bisphosphate aldolase
MPLEAVQELTQHAYRSGYAIGYFESWNLESLAGVVDAAEKTRSPIIIGFNGEFLSASGREAEENLAWYAALGKAAAESAKVPCGLIFNECSNDDWVFRAITLGFNLVMLADSTASYEDYVQRVKKVTEFAHAKSAAVEAELDELPFGCDGHTPFTNENPNAGQNNAPVVSTLPSKTEPRRLAEFVAETNVDLLAVSAGNIHISLEGEHDLDLERLAELHQAVPVPLVLHGGTGITAKSLTLAVKMGVAKVNFGTYLKQRYLQELRDALAADIANPHVLLGMGSRDDVMVAGRRSVRDAVLERIQLLGCCGRA